MTCTEERIGTKLYREKLLFEQKDLMPPGMMAQFRILGGGEWRSGGWPLEASLGIMLTRPLSQQKSWV
jgi:hypothetical protein